MKTIKQNELFEHLSGFLKAKGIAFTDGAYAERIRKSCNLLSDAVNATQRTVRNAKNEVDKKLDQLRQTIHEATAPKPPPAAPASEPPPVRKPAAKKAQASRKTSGDKASKLRVRKGGGTNVRSQPKPKQ